MIMDYSILFANTLKQAGFDVIPVYNCFDPNYDPDHGWPLKMPDVELRTDQLVLLHFQDFVTVSGSTVLELQRVEQHYRDRSNQVLVTYWPHRLDRFYHGSVNLIEFNAHEYAIIQNLRLRSDEWLHHYGHERGRAWQCLNGRIAPHRMRTYMTLKDWPNGVLSYDNHISHGPWSYDTYPSTENEDNFIRLSDIYSDCAVNIVTETQYQSAPGIITEKTFFAFLAGQIPVVIGHPGIVSECRDLGFDMFEDLVDIGYDQMSNEQRVEAALWSNRDLILGRIDLTPYQHRLKQQQRWVLDQYTKQQQQRFQDDCEVLARKLLG
jgi:hypothetical protein